MTAISTDEAVVRYGVRHTRRYGTGIEPSPTGPYVRYEDCAALRARCEALEADAARYQWLRDPRGPITTHVRTWVERPGHPNGSAYERVSGDALDAVIDAARTTTEEGNG